jgi:hypothetical protein
LADRQKTLIRLQRWSIGFIVTVLLCGCQAPLPDVLETFFTAVADRDIPLASNFLTPGLRQSVSNVPYACDAYLYRIERIRWQINNIYATPNGLACAAIVEVEWKGASTAKQDFLLLMDLKRMPPDKRWYISGMTVQQQHNVYKSLAEFIRYSDAYFAGLNQ